MLPPEFDKKGLLVFNYARVSTEGKNQDCFSQLDYLHNFETQKGWQWVDFYDEKSGMLESVQKRDGLRQMFTSLRSDYYASAGICVFAPDRLARSIELGMKIARKIKDMDKFLFVPQSGLFMDKNHWGTPEIVMFNMSFLVGEVGNVQHAQDVKRGIAQKWVTTLPNGGRLSRWNEWRRKPFDLEKAKALRASGKSFNEIANLLGAKSKQFVWNRLKKGV